MKFNDGDVYVADFPLVVKSEKFWDNAKDDTFIRTMIMVDEMVIWEYVDYTWDVEQAARIALQSFARKLMEVLA